MKENEMKTNGLATVNNGIGPRKSLRKCSRGLSTVEYIILLLLIAVSGITIWGEFGNEIMQKAEDAKDAVHKDVKRQE